MITKITIGKIFLNAADKTGKAYVSKKTGEPYKVVNITYSSDGGAGAASGFAEQNSPINQWKAGEERYVELTSREYNGKQYWNFRPANENQVKLMELEARVKELEDAVFVPDEEAAKPKAEEELPPMEELPF